MENLVENGNVHQVGPHTMGFDPPDILVFRAVGDVTVNHAREFIAFTSALSKPEKGFFYLSDLRKFGNQSMQVTLELRKVPPKLIRATGVVGRGFRLKVIVDVIVRAAKFLKLEHTDVIPAFFETEDEARAWFDELRKADG